MRGRMENAVITVAISKIDNISNELVYWLREFLD